MSFGIGASTRIFGLFSARRKSAKIQAIRHEIRPTIGFSYHPDLNSQNFYRTQVDTLNTFLPFSVFEGNIVSPFGNGTSGSINFGIDNNLQLKVRNKKDTAADAVKKVTIIDGLSINGGYDLLADSFPWQAISMNARSTLFEKVNITAGATFDPYEVNARGQRLKTLVWKRKPLSFGRLLGGNISVSSQFQGGDKDKSKSAKDRALPSDSRGTYTADEYENELNSIRNNPAEYADFSIPWSVNFSVVLAPKTTIPSESMMAETSSISSTALMKTNASVGLKPSAMLCFNVTRSVPGDFPMIDFACM